MGQVAFSVRFTDDAWDNFQQACVRSGLTNRSALETAIELVSLFCAPPDIRHTTVPPHLASPALEEVVFTAWEFAVRLNERHRKAREERHKITIRTAEEPLEALTACLKKHEVSLNTALASVFTPWGSQWTRGNVEAYRLRQGLWEWAAIAARERDHARRTRNRSPLPARSA